MTFADIHSTLRVSLRNLSWYFWQCLIAVLMWMCLRKRLSQVSGNLVKKHADVPTLALPAEPVLIPPLDEVTVLCRVRPLTDAEATNPSYHPEEVFGISRTVSDNTLHLRNGRSFLVDQLISPDTGNEDTFHRVIDLVRVCPWLLHHSHRTSIISLRIFCVASCLHICSL